MAENNSPDADAQTAKGGWKFPKLTIDHGVTIGVAFLAFIMGLFTQWLFTTKPDLYWSASEVLPFKGDKEQIGIFNLNVQNGGSKEVEEVTIHLQVPSGTFTEAIVSPKIIANPPEIKGDNVTVVCKTLNPKESVQVSALIRSKDLTFPKPNIIVRGKTVTGYESKTDSKNNFQTIIISVAALFVSLLGMWSQYREVKASRKKIVVEYVDSKTMSEKELDAWLRTKGQNLQRLNEVLNEYESLKKNPPTL